MKVHAKMCMSLLIALVGAGLVCGAGFAADETAKAAPADYVQAYYFHATYRCKTCTTLDRSGCGVCRPGPHRPPRRSRVSPVHRRRHRGGW